MVATTSALDLFLSCRGAPGRLARLQDIQRLLDDFGIPLQIGTGLNNEPKVFSGCGH